MPISLDNLGLGIEDRRSHLAWDIGTAELTRALADALALPAVLCGYSRLVVDCNRSLEDPTAFLTYSDARHIPGNQELDNEARARRADAVYWPYHRAIDEQLKTLERQVEKAAIVSIHSFTPVFDGKLRQWDAGVLWDKDDRLSAPLLRELSAEGTLVVGDNMPYSGRSASDFTVDNHGEQPGRAHVALEVRQDHLSSAAGVKRWADLLARILADILSAPELYVANGALSESKW